jgi:hypothetical protein
MESVIRFVASNFTLSFFALGLITAALSLLRKPRPWSANTVISTVFSQFLLFSIGVSYFYNFLMHVFFGEMAARFIGWANSPFQLEVGFASLGFSAIGLLAFWGGPEMRLAAVLGPALFLWGAAGGHLYQMIATGNFAPGNAGVIFYTDIVLPIVGFALLWLERRSQPMHAGYS